MLLLLVALASADQSLEGDEVRVWFDGIGTWNDGDAGRGFQARHGSDWVDWTYWGYPWQALLVEYTVDGDDQHYYANSNTGVTTMSVVGEADLSAAGWLVADYRYEAEGLALEQTQSWEEGGRVVRVGYRLDAAFGSALEDVQLLFDVDPDPEGGSGVYTTVNDVLDTNGDGLADLALARATDSEISFAIGSCDPLRNEVGVIESWTVELTSDVPFVDPDGAEADYALAVRLHLGADIPAGGTDELTFLVITGDSPDEIVASWAAQQGLCAPCDADHDRIPGAVCGGDDCDDADPATHPGAEEIWYDGVDEDCAGGDDFDQDGDGFQSDGFGGDDCDDTNPAVHPGVPEAWYDGIDQDCDGNDADADGDGYDAEAVGGDDCDDGDPAISPAAEEIVGDGVDQDCDGLDRPPAGGDDSGGALQVKGECGCATGGEPGGAALLLAAAVLARRRRAGAA